MSADLTQTAEEWAQAIAEANQCDSDELEIRSRGNSARRRAQECAEKLAERVGRNRPEAIYPVGGGGYVLVRHGADPGWRGVSFVPGRPQYER